MLVTFQTDAYESITLFGHVASRLLTMMGQSGRVPGAILASDVPQALALLRKAIEAERKHPKSQVSNPEEDGELEVSLVHRALPLIALLQAAETQHCDVMWS
jgi:hypothetical protein